MKHKVTEVLIEIAIIVFAISLSLLLERWRENKEDHHLEAKFTSGLKIDLQKDLDELKFLSSRCISMRDGAQHFLKPENQVSWSQDTINFYGSKLFHDIYFFPNSNRYESLKSTGKLGVIENDELQNNIIDLYQTKIPDLQQQINFFNQFMNTEVKNYLLTNFKRNAENEIVFDKSFFTNNAIKNILTLYGDLDDVLRRINAAIETSDKILKQVD